MGVISADNPNVFKDSKYVFSEAKRFLSSFDDANLLDDGEFPGLVNGCLRSLGIGVYRENEAVVRVKDYKAKLPKGFNTLYAAYKCTPSFGSLDKIHPQGQPISVYNDVTWELLEKGNNCEIDCCRTDGKIIEKITVRQYVHEKAHNVDLTNPILLSLSPNVRKSKCSDDCENLLASSPFEITITDGFIISNFTNDYIYLKYYELPYDEDGLPMIPDIKEVEDAILWYIVYMSLLKIWANSEAPDMRDKVGYFEQKYYAANAEAKAYLCLPTFLGMVNNIRRQRDVNIIKVFAN